MGKRYSLPICSSLSAEIIGCYGNRFVDICGMCFAVHGLGVLEQLHPRVSAVQNQRER